MIKLWATVMDSIVASTKFASEECCHPETRQLELNTDEEGRCLDEHSTLLRPQLSWVVYAVIVAKAKRPPNKLVLRTTHKSMDSLDLSIELSSK